MAVLDGKRSRMQHRAFYLGSAVIGTLVPWWYFGGFFRSYGPNAWLFVESLFANGPAAGFSMDVVISIVVFWFWSFVDARRLKLGSWWLVPLTSVCVGLSLSLPLYLFLRERGRSSVVEG